MLPRGLVTFYPLGKHFLTSVLRGIGAYVCIYELSDPLGVGKENICSSGTHVLETAQEDTLTQTRKSTMKVHLVICY